MTPAAVFIAPVMLVLAVLFGTRSVGVYDMNTAIGVSILGVLVGDAGLHREVSDDQTGRVEVNQILTGTPDNFSVGPVPGLALIVTVGVAQIVLIGPFGSFKSVSPNPRRVQSRTGV